MAAEEGTGAGAGDVSPGNADFREIVESIEDYAIIVLDPAGNVVTWSRGAELICGYEAHEIIGRHCSCLYLTDDASAGKPARDLVEAAQRGRIEDEGWRIRKDGTRWWANVVVRALRGGDGRLRGFVRVARDCTARRNVEQQVVEERIARADAEATARRLTAIQAVTDAGMGALELVPMLRELLARVRAILAADTATVLLVDAAGTHLTAAASSGLTPGVDEQAPVPVGNGFVGQIARERVPIVVPDIAESDVVSTVLRENIRSLAGAPLLVDGRVIGVIYVGSRSARQFTAEEVTLLGLVADRAASAVERSRAHKALVESDRRCRATFEQVAVGMAHLASDRRWMRFNKKLCEILGYPEAELRRKFPTEITHPDDREPSLALSRRIGRGEIDSFSIEKR